MCVVQRGARRVRRSEDCRPSRVCGGDRRSGPGRPLIELGEITQKGGKIAPVWAVEGDFDVSELRSNPFEMEWPPRSGKIECFSEVDRTQWFDPDTARERIFPAQAEIDDRLIASLPGQGHIEQSS